MAGRERAKGVDGDQSNNSAFGAGAAYVFAPGAPPLLGDMNCNGVVNVADIAGFVLGLTDPPSYAAANSDCDVNNAGLNMNGAVHVADIGLRSAADRRLMPSPVETEPRHQPAGTAGHHWRR